MAKLERIALAAGTDVYSAAEYMIARAKQHGHGKGVTALRNGVDLIAYGSDSVDDVVDSWSDRGGR